MYKFYRKKGFTLIELPVVRKRAFTLIELLIVIAIIAILATIVVVSYAGAQKKTRDNKRKADLQSIASAYQIHFQETKRWNFNNAELQKVVSGTSAQCEGYNGADCPGIGFFNYQDGSQYVISMSSAISSLGYLASQPKDPSIKTDRQSVIRDSAGKATASQYMKYTYKDAPGVVFFAMLEDSSAISSPYSDTSGLPADLASNSTISSVMANWNTNYGVNYAIGIK